MTGLTPSLFMISSHDNPETIRFRKYVSGTPLVLEGIGAEAGRVPKETVWAGGPAKLYRYEPGAQKEFPVPILLAGLELGPRYLH